MKIVVDAFGGDNAPLEIIKGAAGAVKEYGVEILLTGDEQTIRSVAAEQQIPLDGIEIVHAPEVLSMHDDPTSVVKSKRGSSMGVAFDLLADGKADAFVSAGSTGAVVVGGTLIVKRIRGVKRPALASMIPAPHGSYLLMDVGANAECRPEMLAQFGVMASVYLEQVEGRENPSVGLLNIGVEESKGTPLQQEAYRLLERAPIRFVGNIESRELPTGGCDAVITDGYTGNISLKLIEGVTSTMFGMLKEIFLKNFSSKMAYLLVKDGLRELRKKGDAGEVGGAPLLGTAKPVIKAHGNSDARAMQNAIRQAIRFTERDVIGRISAHLQTPAAQEDEAAK